MGEYDGDGLRAYGIRAGKRKTTKRASGLYAGKKKTTNPWIKHVKAYAKSHGLTYNEALKAPGVKRGYKKTSSGSGMRAGARRTSSKMPKMTKKMMNMMMMEMIRKKKSLGGDMAPKKSEDSALFEKAAKQMNEQFAKERKEKSDYENKLSERYSRLKGLEPPKSVREKN